MVKTKIAVLVSGGGTNLQALLDAQAAGKIPHGEIALVVSNNKVLQDFLDKEGVGKGRCTRQQDVIGEAYRTGNDDGYNIQIKKGVTGKSTVAGLL